MTALRRAFLIVSALAAGAAAAAAPAWANSAGTVLPGNPAESCRVVGRTGGGEDIEIHYAPDCTPMYSLNVVRKGPLGVARAYGDVRTPILGGGYVTGWEGGREGGPVYESGSVLSQRPGQLSGSHASAAAR
jgi:hypothetical protein